MENIDILEKLESYLKLEDVKHYSDWYLEEIKKERMLNFEQALVDFLSENNLGLDNKKLNNENILDILYSQGLIDDFLNFILDNAKKYLNIIVEACKV